MGIVWYSYGIVFNIHVCLPDGIIVKNLKASNAKCTAWQIHISPHSFHNMCPEMTKRLQKEHLANAFDSQTNVQLKMCTKKNNQPTSVTKSRYEGSRTSLTSRQHELDKSSPRRLSCFVNATRL